MNISNLIKDLQKIDIEDITSCWQWKLEGQGHIIMVSCIGDMFFEGKDKSVYWLQADRGLVQKVANDILHFEKLLFEEESVNGWLHPQLIDKLIAKGMVLKENEVYSLKIMSVLGGDWTIDNFIPTDMSVHFAFTGQINEQVKDLPEGIRINNVKFEKE